MNRSDCLQKITRAKKEIGVAEAELADVLHAMEVSPGIEKVSVSEVVGDAFDKLRAAKASLADLEALLASDREE